VEVLVWLTSGGGLVALVSAVKKLLDWLRERDERIRSKVSEDYEVQLSSLRESFATERRSLQEQLAQQLNELRAQYDAQMAALHAEHKEDLRRAQQVPLALQDMMENMEQAVALLERFSNERDG
jgi:paraquat-inducible protein B